MTLRDLMQAIQGFLPGGAGLPEERRRLARVRCYIPVRGRKAAKSFDANVVEIGVDGVRMRTREKLGRGDEVFVEYPHKIDGVKNNLVRCTLVWSRASKGDTRVYGLRFDDTAANLRSSWVKAVLRELGFEEQSIFQRRGKLRVPGKLTASIGIPKGEFLGQARALNVGVGGVLLETAVRLKAGQDYSLRLGPDLGLPSVILPAQCLDCRHHSGESWQARLRFGPTATPEQLKLLGKYILAMIRQSQI